MWHKFSDLVFFSFFAQLCSMGSSNHTRQPLAGAIMIGGDDIDIKQSPYHVSVIVNNTYYCGGSIIRNDVIVSAAHCVIGLENSTVEIRAGSSFHTRGGVVTKATKLLAHPEYTLGRKNSDIGLMWLDQPLTFSDSIKSVDMAVAGQDVPLGSLAFVSGFGFITAKGPLASHLQGVTVPIVNSIDCNEVYKNRITSTMFCAGPRSGGRDACTYDSGSPLTLNGTLFGIVSWGRSCGLPNIPGVYTRVSALSAWVHTNINENV